MAKEKAEKARALEKATANEKRADAFWDENMKRILHMLRRTFLAGVTSGLEGDHVELAYKHVLKREGVLDHAVEVRLA